MDAHIADIDEAVSRDAARLIESDGPDLSWLYLQYTDDVGHERGDGPELDQAVVEMDARLSLVWSAVQARQKDSMKTGWSSSPQIMDETL